MGANTNSPDQIAHKEASGLIRVHTVCNII